MGPDELLSRFPEGDIRDRLRPSAEVAVTLVGLAPEVAWERAQAAGFRFVPIEIPDDGRVVVTADLAIGRIRGFVRDGAVQSVQVG